MARTVSDALAEARIVLQDQVVPYRYPDDDLLRYLNNSFAEMRRVRPDLFVGRFSTPLPSYTSTELADTYPLEDMYFPASVSYMVSMAEMRNDQSAVDGRAASFLGLFMAQLGGG